MENSIFKWLRHTSVGKSCDVMLLRLSNTNQSDLWPSRPLSYSLALHNFWIFSAFQRYAQINSVHAANWTKATYLWFTCTSSFLQKLLNLFKINWQVGRVLLGSYKGGVWVGGISNRQLSRLEKKLKEWLIPPLNLASALKTDTKTSFHHCSGSNSLGLWDTRHSVVPERYSWGLYLWQYLYLETVLW